MVLIARISIIVCSLVITSDCFAQAHHIKCDNCSASSIAYSDNISEMKLYCFLKRFSFAECRNAIEYMEYANSRLFDILKTNSRALIAILNKYPELNIKYLHDEIKSPLLDYDIRRLIFMVDSVNEDTQIKRQIVADLKTIRIDENGFPK
ncbi:MAG: hypothetical protein K0Q79_1887 [Flavipsychrobacter sp.]|jgi:hypothetical protein|nr:hypothetical protein [Flavipsychrobacter sp.]